MHKSEYVYDILFVLLLWGGPAPGPPPRPGAGANPYAISYGQADHKIPGSSGNCGGIQRKAKKKRFERELTEAEVFLEAVPTTFTMTYIM